MRRRNAGLVGGFRLSARKRFRAASKPLALAFVLLGGLAVAGCDAQEDADLERGRDLFATKCGTCHVLAEAATAGDLGPDLDAAFLAARAEGSDNDTIEGVVQAQIENPRPADPSDTALYMPANLVEGQDLEDVAAYVGKVAGVPGIEPPLAPGGEGGQVFANNGCGSCHTMTAAGSTGTTGPNLDDTIPGQDAAEVDESIVDPGAAIVSGFQDVMPAGYGTDISPEDLELLVDFLLNCSGEEDPASNPDCS